MLNKFIMVRGAVVRMIRKNLTEYIYRSMVLARYNIAYCEVEDILENCKEPKEENEIAVFNFKEAFESIMDEEGIDINKDYLLKLHHILMKGLNENVETDITDIQAEEVHIMINQPFKANTEIAIDVLEYILAMKLFSDGDVRVAIMFANKIMLEGGCGIISIKENYCDTFREKLHAFHQENGFKEFKSWIYKTSIEGEKSER